ncbi:hypothetical protein CMUS01_04810 [Colletotrichum musicola]|uniref:Uncharacterized protein n=1 Tax=Colletotrichum musicola TaxID=2175873 RepID=A0A8H6NLN5_9PEZI|nr:hypothetical protein CMUS01_04810 [Colletotrichum musicola]
MVCLSGTESLVICGSLQLQIVAAAAESSVNNGRTAATGQSSAGTATYLMHSSPHTALQVPWVGWEKASRQDKHVAGLGGHYHRIRYLLVARRCVHEPKAADALRSNDAASASDRDVGAAWHDRLGGTEAKERPPVGICCRLTYH